METYIRFLTRRSFRKLPEEKFVKVDVDLKTLNDYSQQQDSVALQVTWLGHAATFLQSKILRYKKIYIELEREKRRNK